ncbi:Hsp70 nucleotide exchange factor FES1 [Striga asiatica]|uniref:Hsp70 nucleotide exchange factor FES1 n=1 Tax=Striga asiatica TaxID=4170 RepID=A0A5A7RDD5_STRAF|nr:Hsp70 nucleotide exchange factor FES1 [Striga asiatica]
MAREGPNWEGLLKWSLAHSDGTNSSPNLSEEDRKWFMEAMQAQTVDIVKRMKEITLVMKIPEQVLESQGVTPQDIEDMLDELQEHVESIDMANDLHSIGGLVPLIDYLKNSHANIRAKAAEVISTIVQNNPRSQHLVMEVNGLELLLSNFTSDTDVTVRTKSLGAISSLIRHNKPGITAFRLANGYATLRDALSSENVRFQSEDADLREAALKGLCQLAQNRLTGEDEEKLKQILQERVKGISQLSGEERQLVDSLWSIYNHGPCPLRETGFLSGSMRM